MFDGSLSGVGTTIVWIIVSVLIGVLGGFLVGRRLNTGADGLLGWRKFSIVLIALVLLPLLEAVAGFELSSNLRDVLIFVIGTFFGANVGEHIASTRGGG